MKVFPFLAATLTAADAFTQAPTGKYSARLNAVDDGERSRKGFLRSAAAGLVAATIATPVFADERADREAGRAANIERMLAANKAARANLDAEIAAANEAKEAKRAEKRAKQEALIAANKAARGE